MTRYGMAGIFLALVAMLALASCGGGGGVYMLPTGQDYSLRIVKGGDPNDVLASTERKGHIEMNVGETLNITTIYRFRSAIGDKEKDEFVTATSAYIWLEDVNDKLTYSNGRITAVKAGLDTLLVNYVDNNANETVSCRLEITVN